MTTFHFKTCATCKEEKPQADFYMRSDKPIRRAECSKCYNAKKRNKRHTDANLRINLAKMLGLENHQPQTQRLLINQKISELLGISNVRASKMDMIEYLNECFEYNPQTGVITWKERPVYHFTSERAANSFNQRFARKEAGNVNGIDSIQIRLNHKRYTAHYIAWCLHTGAPPNGRIKHINRNPLDNRFDNLKEIK